jgi:hypothetical protein
VTGAARSTQLSSSLVVVAPFEAWVWTFPRAGTKAKRGTGLGLAIAKQTVEMHGGAHLGKFDAGQRIDVSDGSPHARRLSQASPRRRGIVFDHTLIGWPG